MTAQAWVAVVGNSVTLGRRGGFVADVTRVPAGGPAALSTVTAWTSWQATKSSQHAQELEFRHRQSEP